MILEAIYLLCAAISLVCGVLLLRGHRQSGVRLLFWSGLCFLGLALENAFLFVDLVILPQVDLSTLRRLIGLASLSLLLYGLVWDSK